MSPLGERRGGTIALSVAPMMDVTDRHFRRLARLMSRRTLLYTEMVTTGAILHGDRERHLGFDPSEHPLALQLGGDDPQDLAECARIAAEWGYDEVNLNVGCPSSRVKEGAFGACLMARPERVAECVAAMRAAVELPVTVKHRIGIDELDRYEDMLNFVDVVSRAGADRFSVHARKAWLSGLSPKQNRTVPPLRYEEVYRLKRERPEQVIEINGGIATYPEVVRHLEQVDAVMIGRGFWKNPYLLAQADREVFGADAAPPTRREVIEGFLPYVEERLVKGDRFQHIAKHLVPMFAGIPGGRRWRQALAEASKNGGGAVDDLRRALDGIAGRAAV